MPLPERMKPVRTDRKKMRELRLLLNEIVAFIDQGATEDNGALRDMMARWNGQVASPCEFSDFRDFYSWTSAGDFTRTAMNKEKYISDFTWSELLQVIEFICRAEGRESDQTYALGLLKTNFPANPSDLIYYPDAWFNDENLGQAELTTEEIAGYLLIKSGRHLADAPDFHPAYVIPDDVYD